MTKLSADLEEVTKGVIKNGYLYKWREKEISFAPRWSLRYFVLQGSKLSYFTDDHERRPKRTYELSNCFVKEEGVKRIASGTFHIFGIHIATNLEDDHEGTLLLRLSCENNAEAALWVDMLEQACAIDDAAFESSSMINSPGKYIKKKIA